MHKNKKSCVVGYTRNDLINLDINLNDFDQWMYGKTFSICNGKEYDHVTKTYIDSSCCNDPHGVVYYEWDVKRYQLCIQNKKFKI